MSCGSKDVRRKRVSVVLRSGRKVSGIEADVCAACGERYYDIQAMQRLEAETRD
ncbi:MAG: YgiT-type zinc finger protein [Phycisphaerae bacterium]